MPMRDFIHGKIFHKCYVSFLHWSRLRCHHMSSGTYLSREPHYFSLLHWPPWPTLRSSRQFLTGGHAMSPELPILGLASSRASVSGQGREGREHRASGFSEAAPKCQMMQAGVLMGDGWVLWEADLTSVGQEAEGTGGLIPVRVLAFVRVWGTGFLSGSVPHAEPWLCFFLEWGQLVFVSHPPLLRFPFPHCVHPVVTPLTGNIGMLAVLQGLS